MLIGSKLTLLRIPGGRVLPKLLGLFYKQINEKGNYVTGFSNDKEQTAKSTL